MPCLYKEMPNLTLVADEIAEIVRETIGQEVSEGRKRSSMLAAGVLDMIERLAATTSGAVIEVGAYVGGSIIAAGRGAARDAARKILTIEQGGAHLSHPTMPTKDILRDLRANLQAAGFADRITVIPEIAQDGYRLLPAVLGGQRAGLLMVDADGAIGFHLPLLAPHLAPGCVMVLDDYYEPHKGQYVRAYLGRSVQSGAVEQIGVCGYGTWVGRLRDASLLTLQPFKHDANFAWHCPLDSDAPGDTPEEPQRSTARLFEDGRELGPAHANHEDIRYIGAGRWSHWGRGLYISASDNSDPTVNERRYEIEIDGRRTRIT